MRQALNTIAGLASAGQCDALIFPLGGAALSTHGSDPGQARDELRAGDGE